MNFSLKNEKQHLSDILDIIPSNCILNKRIPGCGATTLELTSNRNSIIIVPNVPVIQSKTKKFPNLLGIFEGCTSDDVLEYLKIHEYPYKLMTTPESFPKIVRACKEFGIKMYDSFFCLIDECHQLVKDVDYREDMVLPMDDFFNFKEKALVSATPIPFNDPRFKIQNFEEVIVTADYDYAKPIVTEHTNNILHSVDYYIICIFVNSIDIINALIKALDLEKESTVYCAPKSVQKLKNEFDYKHAYSEWTAKTMRRVNFFTGRFYSAFDLELPYKPNVLILTDVYKAEHTMIDVNVDAVQIMGRFRNGFKTLSHIYNTNHSFVYKNQREIEEEIRCQEFAYRTIKRFYEDANTESARRAYSEALDTLPFNKLLTPEGETNWFAIDNKINNDLVYSRYSNRFLVEKWYSNNDLFKPFFTYSECDYDEEKLKLSKPRSIKEKRRQILELLEATNETKSEYEMDFREDVKEIDPLIVEAYEVLGADAIKEMKFSAKAMKEAIILSKESGIKTVELIKNAFDVGRKYTNIDIVAIISNIYATVGIEPKNPVKPNDISKYFQVAAYHSGGIRGYRIIQPLV